MKKWQSTLILWLIWRTPIPVPKWLRLYEVGLRSRGPFPVSQAYADVARQEMIARGAWLRSGGVDEVLRINAEAMAKRRRDLARRELSRPHLSRPAP